MHVGFRVYSGSLMQMQHIISTQMSCTMQMLPMLELMSHHSADELTQSSP